MARCLIFLAIIVMIMFLFCSCSSLPKGNVSSSVMADTYISTGKIDSIADSMERTLNENRLYVEKSLEKCNEIDDEIERLEMLFTMYESLVNSTMDSFEREITMLRELGEK